MSRLELKDAYSEFCYYQQEIMREAAPFDWFNNESSYQTLFTSRIKWRDLGWIYDPKDLQEKT